MDAIKKVLIICGDVCVHLVHFVNGLCEFEDVCGGFGGLLFEPVADVQFFFWDVELNGDGHLYCVRSLF